MIVDLVQPLTRPILSSLSDAIASVFSGFNPVSLFADGSIGVLYDNNDLTTMFVDAAGTTPATVNGLVGLQLDKSQGLVLGAELAVNGDFSNGLTGWTTSAFTGTDGKAIYNGVGADIGQQGIPTVAGRWYQLSWYQSGATVFYRCGSGANLGSVSGAGQKTVYVIAQGTLGFQLAQSGMTAGVDFIDNISFKELPGNHRYQATTGSKPILRGTPTGANLVTNGGFDTDTAWTKYFGTTISGGQLNFDGATSIAANATIFEPSTPFVPVVGKTYRITYTITSSTTNNISVYLGGTNGNVAAGAGTYVQYITPPNTDALRFIARSTTGIRTGGIDNIEIVDVSAGSVTAPYGLQYDGVDDFLQTASVNFSATDKMFVCAGVRKLSDAAVAVLMELGASTSTNAGVALFAPITAGPSYSIRSRGSAGPATSSSAPNFAAPITNIVTGIGNIASDISSISVNGGTAVVDGTDQGTGNYSNNPLYFGRRAGTSLPFNGLDFGFVIVGKTLTAAQISSTERYIAQRTGVSF